jgi:hypothetical protein
MEKNRITGLLGAIILFLGVFAPCLDAGIMQGLSYYQISNSFALVLLALSIVSFVLVLTEHMKGLWFTGIGAAVVLTYDLLPFFIGTATIQLQGLDDNVFTRAMTSALMPVQMRWGCAMLAVGVICLVASAASSNPKSTN